METNAIEAHKNGYKAHKISKKYGDAAILILMMHDHSTDLFVWRIICLAYAQKLHIITTGISNIIANLESLWLKWDIVCVIWYRKDPHLRDRVITTKR